MYVIVGNMEVQSFSMLQTPAIMTPLPLFASGMLAHALAERLGVKAKGYGVIVHSASPHTETMPSNGDGGRKILVSELRCRRGACCFYVGGEAKGGDYSSKAVYPGGMSYQPHATADAALSLVIEFEGAVSVDELTDELGRARLGGGTIAKFNRKVSTYYAFEDLLAALPAGFWVSDASDVVAKRFNDGVSPVEAVLSPVDGAGWHVPVTIGYSPISVFEHRLGVRLGPDGEPALHAYGEPVVGLVRLDSVRVAKEDGRLKLWSYGWTSDGDVELFRIFQ